MSTSDDRRRITGRFNLVVFLIGAIWGIVKFLLTSPKAAGVSPEGLILSIGLDTVRYLVLLFLFAWILREFWNRLIADLFPLRDLEYQEAIAVILVAGLLLGG